jgi:hypothetical protein
MGTLSLKVAGQEAYPFMYKVLKLKMHGTTDNCLIIWKTIFNTHMLLVFYSRCAQDMYVGLNMCCDVDENSSCLTGCKKMPCQIS